MVELVVILYVVIFGWMWLRICHLCEKVSALEKKFQDQPLLKEKES